MILFLWLACGGTDDPAKPKVVDTPTPLVPVLPEVTETAVGTVEIEPEEPVHARQLKRMSVSQVRDSMEQISGGVRWGDADESDWDVYSGTLGVADYQLRVESDRSPSVMFQKFLDDAATLTCLEWMRKPDTDFYTIDDASSMTREDVRTNIVGLRWLVQGKSREVIPPIVDDYEELFFKVEQRTESLEAAWQTVCVAMFTHPDFFMY